MHYEENFKCQIHQENVVSSLYQFRSMFFQIFHQVPSFMDAVQRFLLNRMFLKHGVVLLTEVVLILRESSAICVVYH